MPAPANSVARLRVSASLHLVRTAWGDILQALSWTIPVRHAAFVAGGHHLRFEALATQDRLFCFTARGLIAGKVNILLTPEVRQLLNGIRQG